MSLADPSRKSGPVVFIVVILVLVVGALTVTNEPTTNRNALQDLDGLLFGLQSLLQGDAYGFVEGLVNSLSIIGLFILLFVVVYFVFTKTLGNIFNKKLAGVMAIVTVIYFFIDNTVYNKILSLNVFMISILVFSAFLIMLWSFGEKQTKNLAAELKVADPTKEEREAYKHRAADIKKAIEEFKRKHKD